MLETKNLSVFYGRHQALESVSIAVDRGEICVILGANGAGKSTLLKAIARLIPSAPGSTISVNGAAISRMKPHEIVQMGIALVPEGRGIFGELSVAENLELGAYAARARSEEKATLERVYGLFPQLAGRRSQTVRTMSGGEQQMVAIGRALMSKPDILMLDEPSLGLSPILSAELFKVLADIGRTGVGILLVEQNAKQSLKIADRGYLLENGQITGENSAASLARDPSVIRAYLGGEVKAAVARPIELVLPAAMPLSGARASDLSHLASGLARRAQAIQSSYVRAARRAAEMPSAFVGRYDKDADRESIADMVGFDLRGVSQDARRLSAAAGDLARRAEEIHAFHIRTRRLSGATAPTFAVAGKAAPERAVPTPVEVKSADILAPPPAATDLCQMAAELAARATEIQRAHLAALRRKSAPPSAFAEEAVPADKVQESEAQPSVPAPEAATAPGASDLSRMAQDLSRRAAEIQSAYLLEKRNSADKPSAFARHEDNGRRQPQAADGRDTGRHDPADQPTDSAEARPSNGLDLSLNACELAERAARLQSEHLAAARASAVVPSAFATTSSTTSPDGGRPPGKSSNNKLGSKGA